MTSTAWIARHLGIEPHDDAADPDLSTAERQARSQMRARFEAWRVDHPFSDVLDFGIHLLEGVK